MAETGTLFPEVGRAIRDARLGKGMSQGELAKKARISRRQIVLMESGANTTLQYLQRVLKVLGLQDLRIGRSKLSFRPPERKALQSIAQSAKEAATKVSELLSSISFEEPGKDEQGERAHPVRILLAENDAWSRKLQESASTSQMLLQRKSYLNEGAHYVARKGAAAAGAGAADAPPDEPLRQIPDHYWNERGARETLRLVGDSLKDLGYVERDLLFVRPAKTASDGDIVVCNLNGEQLVKVFRKRAGRVMMLSANEKYGPTQITDQDTLEIQGIVVGRSGYGLPPSPRELL